VIDCVFVNFKLDHKYAVIANFG
jgi:hypothetical protein